MAEPKVVAVTTDSGDGAPLAKKPSKKVAGGSSKKITASGGAAADPSAAAAGPSMGPSQLSAATPAAAVPKLHDVPRIPIAEPKHTAATANAGVAPAAATGEAKPRASKKRTATPPSGPDMAAAAAGPGSSVTAAAAAGPTSGNSGGSASALDAAAVAKQAVDAEREKQVAAARREAKRQRAKELDDAKRREELAKQALEEAKRLEEARAREQRRQKELAALNANAEECQEEAEAEGDYDDDDFENYDDDAFEDDDRDRAPEKSASASVSASAKPQTKAKARDSSTNNSDDALSPAELRKIQQAMQAESKELSTSRPSSSSSKASGGGGSAASESNQEPPPPVAGAKKRASTSIASSIAGLKQSLDPRAKRVADILAARKFEVEKVNLLHHAPLSAHEMYVSSLRRGHVRQVAQHTSDGARAALTQTKSLAGVDKSMHFPDDIGLDSGATATGADSAEGDDAHSTVRFFRFLDAAAYACELLAESNAMAAERELESTTKRRAVTKTTALAREQVFPNKRFDDTALEQLLRGRDLAAMCFSPCVSNILMTCYAPRDDATSDKENTRDSSTGGSCGGDVGSLADKSVGCVWDVNQPHQVLYVLKNEGIVSSVCLSPSRELIALAGTEDGSIHVWDLRRQPYRSTGSTGSSADAIAFYSPTYSTSGVDYKTASQHASTIVALDVIDRTRGSAGTSAGSSGGTFQFGSIDDRGIVIIWSLIEFEAGEDTLIADKCVEIGGRVKMVMNTLIDTQQQYMLPKQPTPVQRTASSSSSSSSSLSLGSKASSTATGAAASSVRATPVGPIAAVFKFFPHDPNQFVVGTRTGRVYRGHRFEKTERSQTRAQYRRRGVLTAGAAAAVVCIAFHPFALEYFLVGYEDGSICLFACNASVCVSSWEEAPFGVSVSALQWSTARPGVFFASYTNAKVLVWDLTEQTHAPVFTHTIPALENAAPVELASSLYPLVLSSETIRASRPTIALRCGDSPPFQFALMELSHELASRSRDETRDVETLLASIL